MRILGGDANDIEVSRDLRFRIDTLAEGCRRAAADDDKLSVLYRVEHLRGSRVGADKARELVDKKDRPALRCDRVVDNRCDGLGGGGLVTDVREKVGDVDLNDLAI